MNQYYVDQEMILGRLSKARHEWIKRLAIRLGHPCSWRDLVRETLVEGSSSPFYARLTYLSTEDLVLKAQIQLLRSSIRGLVFHPRINGRIDEDRKYRALVSTVRRVNNQDVRVLVPTPWLAQRREEMEERLRLARKFRDSWQEHITQLQQLRRLPVASRYWLTA